MILKNYYYFYKKAVPTHKCDEIIKFAKNFKLEQGSIDRRVYKNESNKLKKIIKKRRNSKVKFINPQWLYELLHPFVQHANEKSNWNFQWDWSEDCQFTIYKKNEYYDWHADSFYTPNVNGRIRKLSMTLNLSDSKDYEGGNLEFDIPNVPTNRKIDTCTQIRDKGSLVVFPSFLQHRVTPVTKGTRYSLVMWSLGQPFK